MHQIRRKTSATGMHAFLRRLHSMKLAASLLDAETLRPCFDAAKKAERDAAVLKLEEYNMDDLFEDDTGTSEQVRTLRTCIEVHPNRVICLQGRASWCFRPHTW